jgi:hypothetical protein
MPAALTGALGNLDVTIVSNALSEGLDANKNEFDLSIWSILPRIRADILSFD